MASDKLVVLINGPAGSGKTTLGKIFAYSTKKSVLLDRDLIRNYIKNGFVRIGSGDLEGLKRQKELAAHNIIEITKNCLEFGYNVFIVDLIYDEDALRLYEKGLSKNNFHKVMLWPTPDSLAERHESRPKQEKVGGLANVIKVYDLVGGLDKTGWIVIDNSNQTPEESKSMVEKAISKKSL